MEAEYERQHIERRKQLSDAPPEFLLELFKAMHSLLAIRECQAAVGFQNDTEEGQQYRLTAYAVERELLRRLARSPS
jgi:hypothetical protein